MAAVMILFLCANENLPTALTIILVASYGIIAVFLMILFRFKVHKFESIGMVLALIGALVMFADARSEKVMIPYLSQPTAIFLALLCCLSLYLMIFFQSRVAHCICPIRMFTLSYFFVVILLIFVHLLIGGFSLVYKGLFGWLESWTSLF